MSNIGTKTYKAKIGLSDTERQKFNDDAVNEANRVANEYIEENTRRTEDALGGIKDFGGRLATAEEKVERCLPDNELSLTSENPLTNKVITEKFNSVKKDIKNLKYMDMVIREELFETILSEIDHKVDFATLYAIPSILEDSDGTHRVICGETQLKEIESNSFVYNMLFSHPTDTTTTNGVTITNNGDGSFKINGTASADTEFNWIVYARNVDLNHKHLLTGCVSSGSSSTFVSNAPFVGDFTTAEKLVSLNNNTIAPYFNYNVRIIKGASIDQTIKPQIFDLTVSGIDFVTTVEEAKAELLKRGVNVVEYNEYNTGEIRNTTIKGVNVKNANGVITKTIDIPETELKSAGDSHSVIAVELNENNKYNLVRIEKNGSKDLGTMDWSKSGDSRFNSQTPLSDALKPTSTAEVGNLLCVKYEAGSNQETIADLKDKTITINISSGLVYLVDTDYTDPVVIKNSLQGVILNYALAEPIRTVIATDLTFEEVSALIEEGGSIEPIYDGVAPNITTTFVVNKAIGE